MGTLSPLQTSIKHMTINTKAIIWATGMVLAALALSVAFSVRMAGAADFPAQSARLNQHASTTTYTLTAGTAQQVLATSTRYAATADRPATAGRTAVTVQAINCGTNGNVWLRFADVTPAANQGVYMTGSTTITFGDSVPVGYGALRAIAATANCALSITEFRTEY